MFKKVFFQIHWFLGITAGLILALMGITGAIYSYDQQILKWMNPDSYTVQAENRPKLSPNEIYQHFQQQDPELKINSITVASSPTAAANINVVKEGARRGLTIMINPYSAEVLPQVKGQAFFAFIQQLHRNLTVGPVGKQITGACTLILIFFVLSGIYLRWPKRHSLKQWFFVKPQLKGRNFLWDLHAVVGTWVVIFYLILACTGLYWSYDWWRNGMFKVLGVERPQAQMQANPTPRNDQQQHAERGQGENTKRGDQTKPPFGPEQIQYSLQQSWTGIQTQLGREYSTLTLNIPKKANGEVSISFVDAIPQHERARNSATFNYENAQFTEMSLYEDKKLNEKIMSSMLPVHRGSFFGPIYQFFAMLASLSMPLFFVTGWMLYLKRRKQKKVTAQARQAAIGIDLDPNAKPWLIAYATQTGVSEQLAWATAQSLQQAKQPVTVKSVQQLSTEDFKQNSQILFIASTYGTGEAPDLASSFEKKFLNTTLDLSHVQFAVLALGAKEYPETYCSFGHRIADWLKQNKAQALFETIEVDNASVNDIQKWNQALAQAAQLELTAVHLDKNFATWTLTKRELLNPNSLGAPAFNLELNTQQDTSWQAGDIAEIQPGNSTARIQQFIQAHALNTAHPTEQQHLNRSLWKKDLTQPLPHFQNVHDLIEQLPDLPTREYSIASIPAQNMLRLVVRQHADLHGHLGLGSGWLTEHTQPKDEIALRIRRNTAFHLIDDDRPIICIGNGTGIAGLMSLISAREQRQHTQNWLIFGERQREHDYFYQDTLEAWKTSGTLQRLDVAFSRDQAEKIYVHHVLRQNAEVLKTWINNGAVLYVCGSIQGMASDVDQALIELLGANLVDELRQQGRYRRDVY